MVNRRPLTQGSEFDPGLTHVLFAAVKLTMGRVFLRVLVFPVNIAPPILHIHLQLHAVLATTNGRNFSSSALSDLGKHWTGKSIFAHSLKC
jgi:hypothetical protein